MELSDIKIILKKKRSIEKDYRNYCKNLFGYINKALPPWEDEYLNIFTIHDTNIIPSEYYKKIYNQDDLTFEELLELYYIVSKNYHNESWFNFHCNISGYFDQPTCYGENSINTHLKWNETKSIDLFFKKHKIKKCNENNNYCIFCNDCSNCINCIKCNDCDSCIDCENCNECKECINCRYSNRCNNCYESDYCYAIHYCEYCEGCSRCTKLSSVSFDHDHHIS